MQQRHELLFASLRPVRDVGLVSVRPAEDQERLAANSNAISNLIIEADYWAGQAHGKATRAVSKRERLFTSD